MTDTATATRCPPPAPRQCPAEPGKRLPAGECPECGAIYAQQWEPPQERILGLRPELDDPPPGFYGDGHRYDITPDEIDE